MRILTILIAAVLCAGVAFAQAPYRLKPGDTLEVNVFQEPDLGRQVLVGPDGQISFPLVGRVRAGGATLGAVENTLKQRLDAYYKEPLDVTVLLAGTGQAAAPGIESLPTIYVTGEVQKPGAFQLRTRTTLLQALALSGGLSPFAAKRRILVRRTVKGEEEVYPFDYRAVEEGRPNSGNISLRHGDVIVVPERGLFE